MARLRSYRWCRCCGAKFLPDDHKPPAEGAEQLLVVFVRGHRPVEALVDEPPDGVVDLKWFYCPKCLGLADFLETIGEPYAKRDSCV